MPDRWTKAMWTGPPRTHTMSDSQLSVLKRFVDRQHNLLAFDLSIWGPVRERSDGAFTLAAHHQNASGTWVATEVAGPQNLDGWLEAWHIATSSFVHGAVVEIGVSSAHWGKLTKVVRTNPRAWFVCAAAEWEHRYEFARGELLRRQSPLPLLRPPGVDLLPW